LIAAVCFALLSIMLVACQPRAAGVSATAPQEVAATTTPAGGPPRNFTLGLVGYNYTDRHMTTFEVNGQGGGNLGISTPTAGGGSSVCCVGWLEDTKLPRRMEIKWAASYCIQRRTNSDGETRDWREPILHIADVEFVGPVPANPAYFEVHFYPDGHIELAMTAERSPPRVILQSTEMGYRPNIVINDPPCAADYERAKAFNQPVRVNASKR
jgi:hypothetical protein